MNLVLTHRNFRWVLLAQGASRLADSLESLVFAWYAYQLTGSTLIMGAIFAVNALPNIVLAPWSGVLADRYQKLVLMRVAAAGRALLAVVMVFLLLTNVMQVWMLFAVTVLVSSFETLGGPAQSALARHLVEPERLAESAGLTSTVTALAQMLGLALAAVLVGPLGMSLALAVDAALATLALVALLRPRIVTDQVVRTEAQSEPRGEFTAGFRLILQDRLILIVVALALVVNLFFTPLTVLETPLVKLHLGGGPEVLAGVGLCLLAGMMSSGLVVGRVVTHWGTWNTLTAGLAGLGVSVLGLGWVASFVVPDLRIALALGFYLVAGVGVTFANASISVWAQARIPPEVQGRVFSVVGALGMAATPLGAATSGAVAELVSIPVLLMVAGGLVLVVSAVGRWSLGSGSDTLKHAG